MKRYVIAYGATAVVFFGLDLLWLGTVATGFYKEKLGSLMAERPNIAAAGVFYAAYVVGIVIFAEMRGFETGSWVSALVWGALFGFFAYATYNMTNYATLKDYPAVLAAVDLAWGTVLTAVSAAAGYAVATRFTAG